MGALALMHPANYGIGKIHAVLSGQNVKAHLSEHGEALSSEGVSLFDLR